MNAKSILAGLILLHVPGLAAAQGAGGLAGTWEVTSEVQMSTCREYAEGSKFVSQWMISSVGQDKVNVAVNGGAEPKPFLAKLSLVLNGETAETPREAIPRSFTHKIVVPTAGGLSTGTRLTSLDSMGSSCAVYFTLSFRKL